MLTLRRLKNAAGKKRQVSVGSPFGPGDLVYKVGGKMFALIAEALPPRISLKCDPGLGEVMRETYSAVSPGYHLDKRHWNTVLQDGAMPDAVVLDLLDHSYDLVVSKLPTKVRIAITRERSRS